MSDNSKIEWTDATWNPITGCSVVSPGCTNCYAMKLAGTRLKHHPSRAGLTTDTKAGPVWTGEVRLNDEWLTQPLTWKRPRNIFVSAHGDLFHKNVPDEWIDKIFAGMALARHHIFQVLTKRTKRMLEYLTAGTTPARIGEQQRKIAPGLTCYENIGQDGPWPLPNVLLGASVEDQDRADQHRDNLGPLARRYGWRTFVSYEPALGPVDWIGWGFLSWMISGGESGADARPSHPDWHRDARDFCARAGIPFVFKQWGAWVHVIDRDRDDPDWRANYSKHDHIGDRIVNLEGGAGFHGERVHVMRRVGKKAAGRLLDGVEHNEMPRPAL